jgi:copper(I)-binding protein
MLINLTRDLKPGQVVELTLVFQKAGKVPVTAQVK